MVYTEVFDSKSKALAREKLLKSFKSENYLKKIGSSQRCVLLDIFERKI